MFLGKLPIDVFIYMAVNIGLLILAFWFYILLLILREFRLFAKAAGGAGTSNPEQQYLLQHCREAIDKSMKFVEDNQHTIQELANLQVHLEQQLAEVKRSTQDHISTEEQTRMDDLNSKLLKSHRLIKKLRGDSVEEFRATEANKKKTL